MTETILIAAVGKSGQLGLNGGLPWGEDFKEDRIRFRDMTTNHIVVMGWKTYLGCVHLDGTYNRILKADSPRITPSYFIEGSRKVYPDRKIFIAGGAKTYMRWLPYVTRFDITQLSYDGPADTYFPPLFVREPAPADRKTWLQAQVATLEERVRRTNPDQDPIGHRQRLAKIQELHAELFALTGDDNGHV